MFRNGAAASLRQVLEEQVVALVTAVDLDPRGDLVVNLLDPDSRLDLPNSGQYATLRDAQRAVAVEIALAHRHRTGARRAGAARCRGLPSTWRRTTARRCAELSEGLQWEYGSGPEKSAKKLVFTVAESTAPQMRQLWTFRREMAIWFGSLALALLATMAWMMRRALAPVRRLEQEIAAGRDRGG